MSEGRQLARWLRNKSINQPLWTGVVGLDDYLKELLTKDHENERRKREALLPYQCVLDKSEGFRCFNPGTSITICETNPIESSSSATSTTTTTPMATACDCEEIMETEGENYEAGIKPILINNQTVQVYCDEDGFTTIQSRGQFGNPVDYFYRFWDDYLNPFGTAAEEFWLGLKNIFFMTNNKNYSLKTDGVDLNGIYGKATWAVFRLMDNVSLLPLLTFLILNQERIFRKASRSKSRATNHQEEIRRHPLALAFNQKITE